MMRFGPGLSEGGGTDPRTSSIFRTHRFSASASSRPLATTSSRSSGYSLITAQPPRDRRAKYAAPGQAEWALLPHLVIPPRQQQHAAARGRRSSDSRRFCAQAVLASHPGSPPLRARLSPTPPTVAAAGPWSRGPPSMQCCCDRRPAHRRVAHVAERARRPRRVGIFLQRSNNYFFLFRCYRKISGRCLFIDEHLFSIHECIDRRITSGKSTRVLGLRCRPIFCLKRHLACFPPAGGEPVHAPAGASCWSRA
jgi:hypothetical protein